MVTRIGATDATLTTLTLSGITDATPTTLVPAEFASDMTSYTAMVPNDLDDDANGVQDQTTVVATPVTGASVELILPPDADGAMAGHQVALSAGTDPTDTTEITVTVLAADGKSSETYTVTVTRTGSDDTTLKSLSLSGATLSAPTVGGDGNVTYTATVPYAIEQTTVTAMATHAEAEAVITPADANEDMAGHQVNLGVGTDDTTTTTTITVTVTAEDASEGTHTVTVTRAVALDATLTKLSLMAGDDSVALSPKFASGTTAYTASVASDDMAVTITATQVAGATFSVTRTAPGAAMLATVGDDGYGVTLQGGTNTIEVAVTSSDVSTDTTYTVTVFKVHANTGVTLSLSDGIKVTPVEGSATQHEASVARSVTQVTATVTVEAEVDVVPTTVITPVDADDSIKGHQVNLAIGANTIAVAVTAEVGDAAVTTTHTVVVTRAASSDATLATLSLDGVTLTPAFDAATMSYWANVANDVASTTVMATAAHSDATVDAPAGQVDLAEGANTIVVTVTAEDGATTMTYTVVVARAVVETVTETVTETVVETVTVPGPTRTKTVTETVIVEVPAAPAAAGVIGSTAAATATEVNGQVMITRHDGGASLVVNVGGFIRDESLGQTYQVVRRMDGMIVRQWVSPNSPLVYQIPWAVVNSQFSVPVGVIGAIPLDDQSGAAGQLVRRFDGGDDRIFSYDGMGGWRHVPDIPTFQALGLYWCDVTAADAGFFDRITIGSPHAATDMPARSDYPSCSTG